MTNDNNNNNDDDDDADGTAIAALLGQAVAVLLLD